jgi:hypothetical protein
MNYPAASGGVSKKTKIFGAASGGESNPSEHCQKPNKIERKK